MSFQSFTHFLEFYLNRKRIYTCVHADWASGAEVALAWRLCGVAFNRFCRECSGPLDLGWTVRIGSARSDRANRYERTWAIGFKMDRTAATYLRFFLLATTARARAGRRTAETRRSAID